MIYKFLSFITIISGEYGWYKQNNFLSGEYCLKGDLQWRNIREKRKKILNNKKQWKRTKIMKANKFEDTSLKKKMFSPRIPRKIRAKLSMKNYSRRNYSSDTRKISSSKLSIENYSSDAHMEKFMRWSQEKTVQLSFRGKAITGKLSMRNYLSDAKEEKIEQITRVFDENFKDL